jgi:hypothetical protein
MLNINVVVNFNDLTDILLNMESRRGRLLDDIIDDMRQDVLNSFDTSPAGRTYYRRGGRIHVASQPYYPPNTDYWELYESFKIVNRSNRIRYLVNTSKHALIMEFGGENVIMRPYIRPVWGIWYDAIINSPRSFVNALLYGTPFNP